MRYLFVVVVAVVFALSVFTSQLLFDPFAFNGYIVRPRLLDLHNPNYSVSQPGEYGVEVGSIIELQFRYQLTYPDMVDLSSLRIERERNGVVKRHKLLGARQLNPDAVGGAHFSYFFKAKKLGTSVIKMYVEDEVYTYIFVVYH